MTGLREERVVIHLYKVSSNWKVNTAVLGDASSQGCPVAAPEPDKQEVLWQDRSIGVIAES